MGKGHLWTPDLWPVLFCQKRRRWNVGLLPDDVPFAPWNMSTKESRENSMCNMSIDFFIVHCTVQYSPAITMLVILPRRQDGLRQDGLRHEHWFLHCTLFSTVQSSNYNVGDFNSSCDTGHQDGLSQDEWKLLLRPRLTGMACPGHHDWPSLSRALWWRHDAFNIHDHDQDQFQISITCVNLNCEYESCEIRALDQVPSCKFDVIVIHALDSDSETSKFFLTL